MLTMYQIVFGEDLLIKEIKKCYKNCTPMMEPYHNAALNYYNLYLFTGGMPEAVKRL